MIRRVQITIGFAVAVMLSFACSSGSNSDVIADYRAPGTVSFVFNRIAVLVLNGGPERRAALEAQIVTDTQQKIFTPASTVLSTTDMLSARAVRDSLLKQGFDSAVTLRLVRETEVNPLESNPGESFSSYASSVPPGEPVFGEDKVLVEASFYRLEDEKLVWRGLVNTKSNGDPVTLARDVVVQLRKRLRETGLIHD